MANSRKNSFVAAYTATRYCISLPDGECVLRVGERSEAIDAWLALAQQDTWAYLTSDNPGSRLLSEAENADRRAALFGHIGRAGWPCCRGRAVADDKNWPDEHGFLLAGVSHGEAVALARLFGQNALLFGRVGAVVELVWSA